MIAPTGDRLKGRRKKNSSAAPALSGRTRAFLHWLIIGVCLACAYGNVLRGGFVFDDNGSVIDNGTIRDVSDLSMVLAAPPRGGATTDARPLVNLSLAVNYALHGLQPWGYHLFNMLVHWLNAGLVLLMLNRLFCGASAPATVLRHASSLAMVCTMLWSLNPIQTGVVSYVSQRAESLACLFYLATLNVHLRFDRSSSWRSLGYLTLLLGGFCKEIIVTAPVVSFLIQRWYGGYGWTHHWNAARREIAVQYLALAPMILLAILHGGRSGTAAVGDADSVTSLEYFVAQGYVLCCYLLSMVIPYWVCVDYGIYPTASWQISTVCMVSLLAFFVWSIYDVASKRAGGLAILCAAIFLSPSSSILPITTQVGGEHRAYLPCLALCVLGTLGVHTLLMRLDILRLRYGLLVSMLSAVVLMIASVAATRLVNESYKSQSSFWERIVKRAPGNLRARQNMAVLQLREGKVEEAFQWFEPLLRDKRQSIATYLEAADLAEQGNMVELARGYLQSIYQTRPTHPLASVIEARLAIQENQPQKAIAMCEQVLRENPDYSAALDVLGRGLRLLGQSLDAASDGERIRELDRRAEAAIVRALELAPWSGNTRFTLASLYLDQGRDDEAERELQRCLIYQPTLASAWYWLAVIHYESGKRGLAIDEVQQSLALRTTPEAEILAGRLGIGVATQ